VFIITFNKNLAISRIHLFGGKGYGAVMDSHGSIYWPFGILLTQCNWLGSNTWPLGQWRTAMALWELIVTVLPKNPMKLVILTVNLSFNLANCWLFNKYFMGNVPVCILVFIYSWNERHLCLINNMDCKIYIVLFTDLLVFYWHSVTG
jgi:hypothetical protein